MYLIQLLWATQQCVSKRGALLRSAPLTLGVAKMKALPNEEVKKELLPNVEDRTAVFSFAMSFNGYNHFGSFEAASENVKLRKRNTLTDLRNELFMSARGSNHRGDDMFLERYKELLPLIKEAIDTGRLE